MKPKAHADFLTLAALAALLASPAAVRAQTLYVSNFNNNTIEKFTPDGTGSVFANSGLVSPLGVAFDTAGNLYVANSGTITKFTPSGVGSVFASAGLSGPTGLAFDSAGNLYAANNSNNTIEKFTPAGVGSLFVNTGANSAPSGLAFDTAGNLYVSLAISNTIVKYTPGGVGSVFANTLLHDAYGLAFDSRGNLYAGNDGDNNIVKFTPAGTGSVFATTGLSGPLGVAIDNSDNLYVASFNTKTIERFTPGGVGSVFANTGLDGPAFIAIQAVPESSKPVRVAGFATLIPGGTGNFTSLPGAPGYSSSGQVAFYGEGSAGQQGIYRSLNGPPIKVADLNTAIPSGTGNFTSFHPGEPTVPAIDASNVAFFGAGSGGQQGIYVMNAGPPIRIADAATAIPGGTGNFTAFTQTGVAPSPVISGNNVAFFGAGSAGQQGLYILDYVALTGPPIKIADTATAIPGGTGNFTTFPQHPSLSGNNVAFLGTGSSGQQGIYIMTNGPPIKVADLSTAIPSGTGNFTSFFIPGDPVAPAIDGSSVAFFGAGSGGQQGIYVMDIGPPIRVADTATAIPGGTGNFTSFGNVSLSSTDVVFLGLGANGQQGIYDMSGGSLRKLVDVTDILDGRAITGLNLSRTGLVGDPVAFQATFADGSQGIYTTSTVLKITAFAIVNGVPTITFTTMPGRSYSVERKDDLSAVNWTTVTNAGNVPGTGNPVTVVDPDPGAGSLPKRFYHVVLLP